jgi:hypothetical protein
MLGSWSCHVDVSLLLCWFAGPAVAHGWPPVLQPHLYGLRSLATAVVFFAWCDILYVRSAQASECAVGVTSPMVQQHPTVRTTILQLDDEQYGAIVSGICGSYEITERITWKEHQNECAAPSNAGLLAQLLMP